MPLPSFVVVGSAVATGAALGWVGFHRYSKAPPPRHQAKQRAVYSFGYGQYGQLMQGSESDSYVPRKVAFDRPVSQIRASSKTSALLTLDEGEVWTCGFGKHNALGFPSTKDATVPVRVPLSGTGKSLCLSEFGGAVVDSNGVLSTWGRNWQGENGQGGKTGGLEPVEHDCKVVSVARGRQHLVFADERGAVYSCGSAQDGALGVATNQASVAVPAKVGHTSTSLPLPPVTQVACGRDFTFALTGRGQLYSWGRNRWGQLGLGGEGADVQRVPKLVPNLPEIKQVECGENFTACVAANGDVYVCGNAADGQLGNGTSRAADATTFQRVGALPGPVAQVSCGGGHLACVLQDGRLFLWG